MLFAPPRMLRVIASALLLVGAGLLTGLTACSRELFVAMEDASPPRDASANDASPGADAGDAGDAGFAGPGIECGGAICRPRTEVCCVVPVEEKSLASVFKAASAPTARCVARGQCQSVPLDCLTPGFCASVVDAGAICCVRHDPAQNRFQTTECVGHSECDESGPSDVLCNRNAPASCTTERPKCDQASSGVDFDVYGICQHN